MIPPSMSFIWASTILAMPVMPRAMNTLNAVPTISDKTTRTSVASRPV